MHGRPGLRLLPRPYQEDDSHLRLQRLSTKDELLAYCRKYIAKYAMPYDIEFRSELPKTLVGKVAYRVLEEEEAKKNQTADQK